MLPVAFRHLETLYGPDECWSRNAWCAFAKRLRPMADFGARKAMAGNLRRASIGCPLKYRRLQGLERAKGIEPSYAAWEAAVLPLNYARAGRP
jgi:hypothetical protein